MADLVCSGQLDLHVAPIPRRVRAIRPSIVLEVGPGALALFVARDVVREDKGHFVTGYKGGPGRPKGSRNALGEAMIADLHSDWLEHGAQAIRQVRETRPADYLKIARPI